MLTYWRSVHILMPPCVFLKMLIIKTRSRSAFHPRDALRINRVVSPRNKLAEDKTIHEVKSKTNRTGRLIENTSAKHTIPLPLSRSQNDYYKTRSRSAFRPRDALRINQVVSPRNKLADDKTDRSLGTLNDRELIGETHSVSFSECLS